MLLCLSPAWIRKSRSRFRPPARPRNQHSHRTGLRSHLWILPQFPVRLLRYDLASETRSVIRRASAKENDYSLLEWK